MSAVDTRIAFLLLLAMLSALSWGFRQLLHHINRAEQARRQTRYLVHEAGRTSNHVREAVAGLSTVTAGLDWSLQDELERIRKGGAQR